MTATAVPGRAGERLAEIGARAVLCDLYGEVGSRVYDRLSGGDAFEVRELLRLVRPLRGDVLELAAGSGRLTFPLLALGRPVVALELSPPMLDILRERLAAAPPKVRDRCELVEGDMSRFALDRRFGAVVLGTSSVSLLDDDGRRRLYRAVREHLAPGGRFVLSTVDVDPEEASTSAEFDLETGSGNGYRIYEHWSPVEGTRTVTVFPEVVGDGPVQVCTTTIRVLPAAKLAGELASCGLRVVRTVPVRSTFERRYTDVLLEVGEGD